MTVIALNISQDRPLHIDPNQLSFSHHDLKCLSNMIRARRWLPVSLQGYQMPQKHEQHTRPFVSEKVPHGSSPQDVVAAFDTKQETGLTPQEAKARRLTFGPNRLTHRRPVSVTKLLWHQFESPVVLLLIAAAAIALAFGEWKEAIAIGMVLLINGVIGFITELRAARSMEALRQLGNLTTRVRRNSQTSMLPAEDLVPGDIVILEGGDIVTADLRVIESSNLSADESALTGESVSVDKNTAAVDVNSAIGDRPCMVFKGTAITRGSAIGVVVATGLNTELGLISKLVEDAAPERSPLESQLQRLSGQLIKLTLMIVAALAVLGVLQAGEDLLIIKASIALAVAAIPEGLPVVATMALARGMWRMAEHNALIERLSAVETLGSTTVIFTDKTGTLTENSMQLREIDCGGDVLTSTGITPSFQIKTSNAAQGSKACLSHILTACVLCNNAELSVNGGTDVGDPLEQALLAAGQAHGLDKPQLEDRFARVREIAFDSTSKLMGTVHTADDAYVMWVKGAPEEVLDACKTTHNLQGEVAELTPERRRFWTARTDAMAARGMRVLAVATRTLNTPDSAAYSELTFLGLLGLYDPPRSDVREAIAQCKSAGIRVIMLTGDHVVTAKNIAAGVGLTDGEPTVIEGRHLGPISQMSDDALAKLYKADVFARVSPAQKLELVAAFQRDGQIVGMTGDGVNDAPALKQADIGIAMGLRGTQVAREAAAMVLRDDAFSSIVAAIREGRVIFRNIQRFVTYLLSCNLSEILVVGAAILSGLPLPLMPLQILFLNLVTDVFPAFALGGGEGRENILERPPRDPAKPIVTRPIWTAIVLHSLVISSVTLGAFILAQTYLVLTQEEAVTVSFFTLAFAQLWHVFNMRDPRSGVFFNEITRNKYIWIALAISSALLLSALFLPVAAEPLELKILSAQAWALVVGMSLVPLILGQIAKTVSGLRHG
jgi:Ca2+-transporting ATPase